MTRLTSSGSLSAGHLYHLQPGIWVIISRVLNHLPDHYQPGICIIISQAFGSLSARHIIIRIIISRASGSLSAGYYHLDHYQPGIRVIISRVLSPSGSLSARNYHHPDHYQPGIRVIISWASGSLSAGNYQFHLVIVPPGIWSLLARHLVIARQASGHLLPSIMRDQRSG